MFGLIMSGCKEHDVKSMRDTVGETKYQQYKDIPRSISIIWIIEWTIEWKAKPC